MLVKFAIIASFVLNAGAWCNVQQREVKCGVGCESGIGAAAVIHTENFKSSKNKRFKS